MSKVINWNTTITPFGTQSLGGKPKYGSGREYLQKGLELQKVEEEIKKNFHKALPALEALLRCRMEEKSAITVVRPFQYQTSELVHSYEQVEDRENGGWKDGEVRGSMFQDVVKSLRPGTKLVLKGLDHNLQEFIFDDTKGNEVILPYGAKNGLMTQTDIYEDVINFMNKQGE